MTEQASPHHHPRLPEETRQHLHAAREAMRESMEALLPPAFVAKRRAARRELLLAVRSLIDQALKEKEK